MRVALFLSLVGALSVLTSGCEVLESEELAALDGGASVDGTASDEATDAVNSQPVALVGECIFDFECDAKIDFSPCEIAYCDERLSCQKTTRPDDEFCDDGDACTFDGVCQAGACIPGPAITCNSDNPCIVDGCDSLSGCTQTFITDPCDDADACTLEDVCFAGECRGVPKDCDDQNVCTSEVCDTDQGCVYSFNNSPCLDGDGCTIDDRCQQGVCSGTLIDGCIDPDCGDGVCEGGETCVNCPGDCPTCCAADEVMNCFGGCTAAYSYGNGYCDNAFNCEAAQWDNADCLECGFDGFADCNGLCIDETLLGDGVCHDGSQGAEDLACQSKEFDLGDCEICPEGQVSGCGGGCVIPTPADGVCDEAMNCPKNNNDGGDCCPSGQLPNCNGGCSNASWQGDGYCDSVNNCALTGFDGSDCPCGTGYIADCNGICIEEIYTTDDVCQDGSAGGADFHCLAFEFDGGLCSCPEDQIPACGGGCAPDTRADGVCDSALDCEKNGSDGGDCCPSGQVANCFGECTSDYSYANGTCTSAFDCAEADWDGGDCDSCGNGSCGPGELPFTCPEDCGETSCEEPQVDACVSVGGCTTLDTKGDGTCDDALNCAAHDYDSGDCCPEGQIPKCDGTCSTYTSWPGDGYCDSMFDCALAGWDGGDCDGCGNDFCGPAELPSTCPSDCGESTCEAPNVDLCGGQGCGDPSRIGDGTCDELFNCDAHGNDGGDCCPAGDIVNCSGECYSYPHWIGDGFCDSALNCEAHNFDGGDCN